MTFAGRTTATVLMAASFVLLAAAAGIASSWLASHFRSTRDDHDLSADPTPVDLKEPAAATAHAEDSELAALRAENALLRGIIVQALGAAALPEPEQALRQADTAGTALPASTPAKAASQDMNSTDPHGSSSDRSSRSK